jgi:DNA-binding phage protein
MRSVSGAEKYFEGRRSDDAYAEFVVDSTRRISMFDEIIEKLDEERQIQNMSKAELARRSNLPPEAVRRLFSQQHKNPTLTTLVAIVDALGGTLSIANLGSTNHRSR